MPLKRSDVTAPKGGARGLWQRMVKVLPSRDTMSIPVPGSAIERLTSLADNARVQIDALLDVSALSPVEGSSGYYEWRVLSAGEEPLRHRALEAFNSFQNELAGILYRRDRMRLHTLQYGAGEALELIEQRAQTKIATINVAKSLIFDSITESLDTLLGLDDPLADAVLVMPDASALIDFPNLDNYHVGFPSVRLLISPTVLGELDDLKRHHRNTRDEIRTGAQAVTRRIVMLGKQGDLRQGVGMTDRIILMTRSYEPRADRHSSWLNLNMADDLFIAAALEVFWEHPKARVLTISGDFNVVNKAHAAGLSAVHATLALGDDRA
jgi:PIN domain-containing protein